MKYFNPTPCRGRRASVQPVTVSGRLGRRRAAARWRRAAEPEARPGGTSTVTVRQPGRPARDPGRRHRDSHGRGDHRHGDGPMRHDLLHGRSGKFWLY
jgi:hypothetical protein